MVAHRETESRFVLALPAGEAALSYARRGGLVDFYHIYVPPSERGRSLPERILEEAFAWARREGLKVRVTCPYIGAVYLPRHPELRDLLD